jgi:hypothetical protein
VGQYSISADKKEYQMDLKRMESQACEASSQYSTLKFKVDHGLEDIKNSMLDHALADPLIRS